MCSKASGIGLPALIDFDKYDRAMKPATGLRTAPSRSTECAGDKQVNRQYEVYQLSGY
jgi:hypothetical protein